MYTLILLLTVLRTVSRILTATEHYESLRRPTVLASRLYEMIFREEYPVFLLFFQFEDYCGFGCEHGVDDCLIFEVYKAAGKVHPVRETATGPAAFQ